MRTYFIWFLFSNFIRILFMTQNIAYCTLPYWPFFKFWTSFLNLPIIYLTESSGHGLYLVQRSSLNQGDDKLSHPSYMEGRPQIVSTLKIFLIHTEQHWPLKLFSCTCFRFWFKGYFYFNLIKQIAECFFFYSWKEFVLVFFFNFYVL